MRKLLFCIGLLVLIGTLMVSVITAEEVSREGLQASPVFTPASQQALSVSVPATPQAPPGWQEMGDFSGGHRDPNPLDQGADACPATVISSLPYEDSGSTSGRSNDYGTAENCSQEGSAAGPDVIYSYTPSTGRWVVISTCGSSYNTLVELRRNGACPGTTQSACSDYGCWGRAEIRAYLTGGVTYYIVVDGSYAASYGLYQLSVQELCSVTYQAGNIHECWETADTSHARLDCNGGPCLADYGGVPSFQNIYCGQTVYGRAFTFVRGGSPHRDVDWYRFPIPESSIVTVTVEAEFPSQTWVGPYGPCGTSPLYYEAGATCTPYTVSGTLGGGWGMITFAPFDYGGLSNPREYRITLECTPVYGCVVDGTINAPDTVISTTIGAGNDCSIRTTLDRTYRVNLPVDSSVWTFSMCNASYANWNPYLYLTYACCTTPITSTYVGCYYGVDLPRLRDVPLPADSYYLTVEGLNANSAGSFMLAVTGCHRDHQLTVNTAFTDNTCGAGADCDVGRYGDDQMFSVSVTSGQWSFRLQQSSGLRMYLMHDCCSLLIDSTSNDIFCRSLSDGTYYVRVVGDSTHCGPFTLTVEPCDYRCCYGDQFSSCTDTSETACDALGGVFDYTRHCGTNPCPVIPLCPPEAQVSQVPYGSDSYNGTNLQSDITGQTRYDDFAGLTEPITGIRFWGFHRQNNVPCTLQPAPFFVRFRAPGAGPNDPPGDLVTTFGATLTGTPGQAYPGGVLYEYTMDFDPALSLSDGWVCVYGGSTSTCDFYWQTSGLGNGKSWLRANSQWTAAETNDLAFCLTGGGCEPADSVTLKYVSGTTMRLDFYAPQDAVYYFWVSDEWNTEFPTGFTELDHDEYPAGHRSYPFNTTTEHARYVITAGCGGR